MTGSAAYALSRKYTQDTCGALGFLKGANCTVKSIEHRNGINIITFGWTGTDGTERTSEMTVYDGTPIYAWESGNTYHYGDLAIYSAQFYRCIRENSDIQFDQTKWDSIGAADGNYDIVENSQLLPDRFTSTDRKMYYSIADGFFWLWDGTQWTHQEPKGLTAAQMNALISILD